MIYKEVSRAIIYDDAGRVLLAKRARGAGQGQWALIGGKPEDGEEPIETVTLEVSEETGLTFDPTPLREEIDDAYDPEGTPWRVSYFYGKAIGTLALLADENSEARYFGQDELPSLSITFGHLRIINEFLDNR